MKRINARITFFFVVCLLAVAAMPLAVFAANITSPAQLPPAASGSIRIGMYGEEVTIAGRPALKVTVHTVLAADAPDVGLGGIQFSLDYQTQFLEVVRHDAPGDLAPFQMRMLATANLDPAFQERRYPAIPGDPVGIRRVQLKAQQNDMDEPIAGIGNVAEIYFLIDSDNAALVMNESKFEFWITLDEAGGSLEGTEFENNPDKLEYPLTWIYIGDPKGPLRTAVEAAEELLTPAPRTAVHRYVVPNGELFWLTAEVAELQTAYDSAKAVLDNAAATPDQISAATTALNNAIAAFNQAAKVGVQGGATIAVVPRTGAAGFGRIIDIRVTKNIDGDFPAGSALVIFHEIDDQPEPPGGFIVPADKLEQEGASNVYVYSGLSLRRGDITAYVLSENLLGPAPGFAPTGLNSFSKEIATTDWQFLYGRTAKVPIN